MDTQPAFGPQDLITQVVGDMADSLSERAGETRERQNHRRQAATGTIMTFQPRDAVEAMIAGHCVMFHELIVDSVLSALRETVEAARHVTHRGIVAMDKAFGVNLDRLDRYRTPRAANARLPDTLTETEIADRVRRHRPHPAHPSLEPNPAGFEPTTSLEATDPARFREATDQNPPVETGLAAGLMAGLNRQARRAISRQARKHIAAPLPGPLHNGENVRVRRHASP